MTTTIVMRGPARRRWPLLVLALPASVSIWAGWVGLGSMAGFGLVHPLPGIADSFTINSAITLPIGVEAYSAYALGTWLTSRPMPRTARLFAAWSSGIAMLLGLVGQVVYHVLTTTGHDKAPTPVVVFVACLPVLVLGAGATLHHLLGDPIDVTTQQDVPRSDVEESPEAGTESVPAGPAVEPSRVRRPARRKSKQAAPRRLFADYLAEARTHLTPEVDPSPAWCRQVTGCSAGTSVNLAKALRTERDGATRVTGLPTHHVTANTVASAEESAA
jgi:hypothetical protein